MPPCVVRRAGSCGRWPSGGLRPTEVRPTTIVRPAQSGRSAVATFAHGTEPPAFRRTVSIPGVNPGRLYTTRKQTTTRTTVVRPRETFGSAGLRAHEREPNPATRDGQGTARGTTTCGGNVFPFI